MSRPVFFLVASTVLSTLALAQEQRLSVTRQPAGGADETRLTIEHGTPGAFAGFLLSTGFGPPISLPFGELALDPSVLFFGQIGPLDARGAASIAWPDTGVGAGNLFFQSLVFEPASLTLAMTHAGSTGYYPGCVSSLDVVASGLAAYTVTVFAAPGQQIELRMDGVVQTSTVSTGGSTELRGHFSNFDWRNVYSVYVDGIFWGYLTL